LGIATLCKGETPMRKCIALVTLLCAALVPCYANSPAIHNSTIHDAEGGWNTRELVSLYFHNSELQTQWAWQLLSQYTFKGNERVLDFGAGDGKLSALMSFMVLKGFVIGVDLSDDMTDFATKMFPITTYKNLRFMKSPGVDFSAASFAEKFDLVTSFCVFHLVPNPGVLLQNIRKVMRPRATLVMTLPIGGNQEFYQAAQEEMTKRGWSFPAATAEASSMHNPDTIAQVLKSAGFDAQKIQVVETKNPFASIEELIDWFEGTLSANWSIPEDERRDFFADVCDRYLTLRPSDLDADGFAYYSVKRIDIIATAR